MERSQSLGKGAQRVEQGGEANKKTILRPERMEVTQQRKKGHFHTVRAMNSKVNKIPKFSSRCLVSDFIH